MTERDALADFLLALATEPGHLAAFERDPAGVLARAGLSAEARAAVASRDDRTIRAALLAERRGRLEVVGTGLLPAHRTPEACAAVEAADRVYFLVPDPAIAAWIRGLHPGAESLHPLVVDGDPAEAAAAAAGRIRADLGRGDRVCLALFGHPAVLNFLAGPALAAAEAAGCPAALVAGVSPDDALFADLGLDPGVHGYQSYEATDFLCRPRCFDPTAALVLWQVGAVGHGTGTRLEVGQVLGLLTEQLGQHYPADHQALLYEPADHSGGKGQVRTLTVRNLPASAPAPRAALYLPPLPQREPDPALLRELGLQPDPEAT